MHSDTLTHRQPHYSTTYSCTIACAHVGADRGAYELPNNDTHGRADHCTHSHAVVFTDNDTHTSAG